MAYLWTKSLHLLFVMAWVATVFYLPRILVNLAESAAAGEPDAVRARLLLMGRRLYGFGSIYGKTLRDSRLAFLVAAGFDDVRVEQLMTSDAHVFLADAAARDRAVASLESARVNGAPVFQAEADPADPTKLFYQVILWDELPDGAELAINGRRMRFDQYFSVLAHRTGAHLPEGDVFASGIDSEGGGETSSIAIQTMLKRLIDAEDPRKPLSDARLAETLKGAGVPVARRTVAKYREAMGIASSQERIRLA